MIIMRCKGKCSRIQRAAGWLLVNQQGGSCGEREGWVSDGILWALSLCPAVISSRCWWDLSVWRHSVSHELVSSCDLLTLLMGFFPFCKGALYCPGTLLLCFLLCIISPALPVLGHITVTVAPSFLPTETWIKMVSSEGFLTGSTSGMGRVWGGEGILDSGVP